MEETKVIVNQWRTVKKQYPQLYKDLMEYLEAKKAMNLSTAVNLRDVSTGEGIPPENASIYLQRFAAFDNVLTYIEDLVSQDIRK